MDITLMQRELDNLKRRYDAELQSLGDRVEQASEKAAKDRYSDHDAFNMAAACQNLAVLAGKIEQTANVIRWMGEK